MNATCHRAALQARLLTWQEWADVSHFDVK
jgi:hypothetical protein